MDKPLNLLGFDFGSKRIGAAFASNPHTQPIVLAPIKAQDGIPNWPTIDSLVNEWQAQAFVVGIAYNMDGSVSEMALRARKFANRMSARFDRPCYLVDERLSTQEAKQEHLLAGGGTDWKKHGVDGIAAGLILQSWFSETQHRLSTQPLV
ncbi:MAG: Holliday junction resolvase RuvX [Gammaproteobacteria bacterium]|nr:Holliday junction resolvase RuvX [Gammaproteobacteria bacterium]